MRNQTKVTIVATTISLCFSVLVISNTANAAELKCNLIDTDGSKLPYEISLNEQIGKATVTLPNNGSVKTVTATFTTDSVLIDMSLKMSVGTFVNQLNINRNDLGFVRVTQVVPSPDLATPDTLGIPNVIKGKCEVIDTTKRLI